MKKRSVLSYSTPSKNKFHSYSTLRRLREEKKINDDFEAIISNLPLEDLIAAKFEISAKLMGGRLFGLPLWRFLPKIVREGIFNYALVNTRNFDEMRNLLGISEQSVLKYLRKFNLWKKIDADMKSFERPFSMPKYIGEQT